jgi:oligoribonuclease
VRASTLTLEAAEQIILDFLIKDCGFKRYQGLLAGNSVGQDQIFIQKDMPRLYDFLHYRIVDVSTIKELAKRWYPELP